MKKMKTILYVLGFLTTIPFAFADTSITCAGLSGQDQVTYVGHSFRPCLGPCPGAAEGPAVVSIEKRMSDSQTQISHTSESSLTESGGNHEIVYSLESSQILDVGGNPTGEKSRYSPFYQKIESFSATLSSRPLLDSPISVACTKTVTGPSFKSVH